MSARHFSVLLAIASSSLIATVGCIDNRTGPRPGDADAAIGDRGPRRTGTTDVERAPSVEDNGPVRENNPVP